MRKNFGTVRLLLFVLLGVTFWFMYSDMFKVTIWMFNNPLEDTSHGFVIPFVSAYLLFRKRKQLVAAAGKPSWVALLFVVVNLIIFWLGAGGAQYRVMQVSFLGLLWSAIYAFWGLNVAKIALFPIGFLVFTIPMSSVFTGFTVHLRILSSAFACWFMNGFGMDVQRAGTALFSTVEGSAFNVDVAAPCSGIRSIFALMALVAVYAYQTQRTLAQKILLFVMSVPLAVVGNMVRILSICIVAVIWDQQLATGFYHDYSGYVVFLIVLMSMIQVGYFVKKLTPYIQSQKWIPEILRCEYQPPEHCHVCYLKRDYVPLVMVVSLALVLTVFKTVRQQPVYDDTLFVKTELPAKIGNFESSIPLFCHNEQCRSGRQEQASGIKGVGLPICENCGQPLFLMSYWEKTFLPADTMVLKRDYRSDDGMSYRMNIVVGGQSRASIHRAELCMPAQGFKIQDSENVTLKLHGGESITARLITGSKMGSRQVSLVYWLVNRRKTCNSHVERILTDVWDRSIHNRINRWVMFAVFIPSDVRSPAGIERLETFLSEFYPQVIEKDKLISGRTKAKILRKHDGI